MQLARLVSPVTTLGPGKRVGVWVQGCSKKCKGCISIEMQKKDIFKDVPVNILVELIKAEAKRNGCKGVTISGGDPFEQAEELSVLLEKLRTHFDDILVYTGFTFEEINMSEVMKKCLENIDVLIDGKYIEEKNTSESVLRGSYNQKIIFLNKKVKQSYKVYMKSGRCIEAFVHENKVIIVGIQNRGVYDE